MDGLFPTIFPGERSELREKYKLVLTLERLGWTWGGRWADPKDLHHFQKIPVGLEEDVKRLRGP
jgi:hypothetical protein